MSPDLYFALTLIVKMAITAGFVLAATVTAERAGPLVGGLVATLPIGAGPVYVFLALDHDAHFIAQSAVASLAINAVNVIFATGLRAAGAAALALRQPAGRLRGLAGAGADRPCDALELCRRRRAECRGAGRVPVAGAAAAPRADAARAHALVRPGAARADGRDRWSASRSRLSFRIGPGGSGILAVFPIVLISIMIILHRRVGGKPTAAVLANARARPGRLRASPARCCISPPSRSASRIGLTLALATSIGWSLAGLRRAPARHSSLIAMSTVR